MQDWDALSDDERRVYARFQEVFAGFLTHTDAQIGRVVSFLEEIGELDNTLVMLVSDNGTSAEGGLTGTFNEHRFTLALPDTTEENLARLDEFGGFRSYNHYPWGWAWAGNTPLRLWKRYTWLGGIRTPLIVHWPDGFAARGEVREQFVHAIDLMPTVLDACGIDAARHARRRHATADRRRRASGPRSTTPSAPSPRAVQYFEMLGSRSIVYDDWKATTDHVSQGVVDEERLLVGSRDFDDRPVGAVQPRRRLRRGHRRRRRASRGVGAPPGRLARRSGAQPGVPARRRPGRTLHRRATRRRIPTASRCVYRPTGSPVPDDSVPHLFGGFRLTAAVDVGDDPEGVLCAMGDWTNGFAFYVRDGRLVFALEPRRRPPRRDRISARARRAARARLPLRRRHRRSGPAVTLLHDDDVVASVTLDVAVPMFWQHGGTALSLGRDRGFPVCDEYEVPFAWNGVLHEVIVEVGRQMPAGPGRGAPGRARCRLNGTGISDVRAGRWGGPCRSRSRCARG